MVQGSVATARAQEPGRGARAAQVRLRPGPDGGPVPEGRAGPGSRTAELLDFGVFRSLTAVMPGSTLF